MNCEDIAFNLMVANATGKPPIKVYKIIQSKVKTFLHICRQGWSKEKVQMFNSQLWECGDALQCCRWPQWPLIRKKCTFVFPHPGHLEERSRCLDFFLKLYGDPSPLRQVAVDCCVGNSQWYISGSIQSWSCPLQRQPSRCNEKVQWHGEPVISCQVNGCDDQEVPNFRNFRKIKWPCYR